MIICRSAVCEVNNLYEMEINNHLVDRFNAENRKLMSYISEDNANTYVDLSLAEVQELAKAIVEEKEIPSKFYKTYKLKSYAFSDYEREWSIVDMMNDFIEENIYDYFVGSDPIDNDYDIEDTIEDD